MIQRCVAWCSRHSRAVIIVAVALAIWGEHARRRLAAEGVPDLSDPQVGLVVEWMGHPASEVATRVTRLLTESLKSVTGRQIGAWGVDVREWRTWTSCSARRRAWSRGGARSFAASKTSSRRCRRRYAWRWALRLLRPVGFTNTRWWGRPGCRWRWGTACKTRCCATSSEDSRSRRGRVRGWNDGTDRH